MKVRVSLGATVLIGKEYAKAIVDIEDEVSGASLDADPDKRLEEAKAHCARIAQVVGAALIDRLHEAIAIVEGDL